jgi:hypothetical protein
MPSYDRDARTRTLARIVGPYLVIAAAALFTRQGTLPAFLAAFMEDQQLVFVTGAFTVIAGLAMLGAHHHWSSFSAVLVSLIGILATAKGAALMIAPQFGTEATSLIVATPSILLGAIGVDLLLGLWLTFVGWRPHQPAAMPT